MLLFNFVNYVFLLLCLCIIIVMYVLFCIKIHKYRQNTTDLLYSATFGLHVSTP